MLACGGRVLSLDTISGLLATRRRLCLWPVAPGKRDFYALRPAFFL